MKTSNSNMSARMSFDLRSPRFAGSKVTTQLTLQLLITIKHNESITSLAAHFYLSLFIFMNFSQPPRTCSS